MNGSRLRRHGVEPGRLNLQIDANRTGLEEGQLALREFLEGRGSSERAMYHAELAFDELVTNIIKYAYRGLPRPIDASAVIAGDQIVMTVEDDGPPFNPLDVADPGPPTSLETAGIGGVGLRLVRMASTLMEYERRDARNRVVVSIKRT